MITSENGYFKADLFDQTLATTGSILVTVDEVVDQGADEESILLSQHQNREKNIRFKYKWEDLNNMSSGFFGIGKQRQRVRFEVAKLDTTKKNSKKYIKIRSTPFVKQTDSSTYKIPAQTYTMKKMCDNKKNQKIAFSVFNKYDMEVNKVEASVNELLESNEFEGLDGSKLVFEQFEVYDRPSFMEYLKAGWKIEMRGAIDFTTANGKIGDEGSLHNPGESNRYEQIMHSLGSVLEPYSNAIQSTFYGFGIEKFEESTTPDGSHVELRNPYDETIDVGTPVNYVTTIQVDKAKNSSSSCTDSFITEYRTLVNKVV